MSYKRLILDFDGTLADTRESILKTMEVVAEHYGITSFDRALTESLIGLPLKDTFEKALSLDQELIPEATLIYRKHYNEIVVDTIALFDGVKETLTEFHQNGISLTVASSKGKESLIRILQKQQLYDLFSFVGGEEDAKNKKPAPDIVNYIMDKYGYKPNECLVVGDTVFDIEMGQRAGIATCGVTYGNNTQAALKNQGADYIIDSFRDLQNI